MSSDCEYTRRAIRFDKERFGLKEDLFALCILAGSNNLYNHRGARVRRWQVSAIGTKPEAVRTVIRFAGACEGESLRMDNFGDSGFVTPETYIRRWRRVIANADAPDSGRVTLSLQLRVFDHEVVGMSHEQRILFGELESGPIQGIRGEAWADAGVDKKPIRVWNFDRATQVAQFDRFRALDRSSWPASKVSGPGEA